MLRKEIPAILEDDFIVFLKGNNLFEKFQNGELFCYYCKIPLNKDNIFAIFDNNGIQFCCNKLECIHLFKKGE